MSAYHSASNVRCCCCWACGERAALSTSPSGRRRRAELSSARDIDRLSVRVKPREAARAIEDGKPAIGILVHPHGGPDIMMAMALRRYLQREPVPVDAVVAPHLA